MNNQPEVESWKPPFSYDIGGDGKAYDVAVLANPDHSQGEWVKLTDYRELERQRDSYAETLRQVLVYCNRVTGADQDKIIDAICERHPELASGSGGGSAD